jgi:hypothetical protein
MWSLGDSPGKGIKPGLGTGQDTQEIVGNATETRFRQNEMLSLIDEKSASVLLVNNTK